MGQAAKHDVAAVGAARRADAEAIAADAGAFVWSRFGTTLDVRAKGEVASGGRVLDLVTEVDIQSEERIRRAIREANPDAAILGEEGGVYDGEGAALDVDLADVDDLWLVDPIDGTINFALGVPIFCVSIARYHRGVPACGAIHAPAFGETYSFSAGGGVTLNGEQVRVQQRPASEGIASLSGVGPHFRELARNYMNWRRLGSAALTLAWVAAGRFDAYVQMGNISPWDHAVGAPLVLEAGGVLTDHAGEPWTFPLSGTSGIIAGTVDAHATALRVLGELGML